MEEKPKGTGHAVEPRQEAAEGAFESGWVTTEDAAAALGVSPRTIRDYIRSGGLEAKSEGSGVLKRWLVSKEGVQAMLEKRRSLEETSVDRRESAAGSSTATEGVADAAGDESAAEGAADAADGESTAGPSTVTDGEADVAEPMVAALQNLQYRLGYTEARLELTEQTANTLQAELDRLREDLKRERGRVETERERVEEFRYIVHRLQGQEFEARQKAERREWQRDQAQEEMRRLREELEAERGKGLRRMVVATLIVIFVVTAISVTAATLYTI